MTRVEKGTCKSRAPGTSPLQAEDRSCPEHVDEIEISDRHRMYKVSRIREQPKEKKEKAEEGGRNREKNRETEGREREGKRLRDTTSNQRKSLG